MEIKVDPRKARRLQEVRSKLGKRILIIGSNPMETTGHGKTLALLSFGLMNLGHKVFNLPVNYNMAQIYWNNLPILPTGFHPQIDPLKDKIYLPRITDYINEINKGGEIDYIIFHGDRQHLTKLGLGRIATSSAKIILYTTPDSEGFECMEKLKKGEDKVICPACDTAFHIEEGAYDIFEAVDKIITTTKFGQQQIKKWEGWDVDYIYQSINNSHYHPIDKHTRKELRKFYGFLENDFVIFAGGRNTERKRHEILIEAAAKLICKTDNVKLLLNIPYEDQTKEFSDRYNMVDYIRRIMKKGIGRDLIEEARIKFVDQAAILGHSGIDEKAMAELYQVADVYASAAGGEGFGLMVAEAMSCGIPVVVPDNSTMPEIVGKEPFEPRTIASHEDEPIDYFEKGAGGLLVNCEIKNFHVGFGLRQDLATPDYLYKGLEYIYKNPDEAQIFGERGRKRVINLFSVDEFIKKWHTLLTQGFNKRRSTMGRKAITKDFTTIPLSEDLQVKNLNRLIANGKYKIKENIIIKVMQNEEQSEPAGTDATKPTETAGANPAAK